MNLNSKYRSFWYSLKVDPLLVPWLVGYCTLILLSLLCPSRSSVFLVILWLLIFGILEYLATHGLCIPPMERLTPNFYVIHGLRYNGIFQCQATRKHSPMTCLAVLRVLLKEQDALPAALATGRYRAVTHETILRRLETMSSVKDVIIIDIGQKSLEKIVDRMLGGRCRSCTRPCPIEQARKRKRPFYYVEFTIKK